MTYYLNPTPLDLQRVVLKPLMQPPYRKRLVPPMQPPMQPLMQPLVNTQPCHIGHGSTPQPLIVSTHSLQDTAKGRRVLRGQTRVDTHTAPPLMRRESQHSGMCSRFAAELVDKMLKRGPSLVNMARDDVAVSFSKKTYERVQTLSDLQVGSNS